MKEILKKIGFALATISIGFLYMWLVVAIEANYASESVRFLIFFFLSLGFIIFCAREWRFSASEPVEINQLVHNFLFHYPLLIVLGFEFFAMLPVSIVFKCACSLLYGLYISDVWAEKRGVKGLLQRLHIIN